MSTLNDQAIARELARLILPDRSGTEPAKLAQGVIAAVDVPTRTVTVFLSGNATIPVSGIKVLDSGYTPVIGQTVWMLKNGPDIFVLGRLNDGTDTDLASVIASLQKVGLVNKVFDSGNYAAATAQVWCGMTAVVYADRDYLLKGSILAGPSATDAAFEFKFIDGTGGGTTQWGHTRRFRSQSALTDTFEWSVEVTAPSDADYFYCRFDRSSAAGTLAIRGDIQQSSFAIIDLGV